MDQTLRSQPVHVVVICLHPRFGAVDANRSRSCSLPLTIPILRQHWLRKSELTGPLNALTLTARTPKRCRRNAFAM